MQWQPSPLLPPLLRAPYSPSPAIIGTRCRSLAHSPWVLSGMKKASYSCSHPACGESCPIPVSPRLLFCPQQVTLIHSKIALADPELLDSVRQEVKEILLRKGVRLLLSTYLTMPLKI